LCPGTDVRESEQKKLLNVSLVKKRACDFDWTDEVPDEVPHDGFCERNNTGNEESSDEESSDNDEFPKYNTGKEELSADKIFSLRAILLDEEKGVFNEAVLLLLMNMMEEERQRKAEEEKQKQQT
jgi:hypothetical protein